MMRNCGLIRLISTFLFCIFIYKSTCNIFDICSTNPCHSNGYCISNDNGEFHCRCLQGWTGYDCSVDVDECHLGSTNPCEHDGVCINSPGDYQCLCPPGYNGSRCEDEILECAFNPCKHDGTCIDLINGFQCICPLGYEGVTCEDEINECSSSPCKNGAQCEDLINNYTCHCLPGWTGLHCENRIRPCAANSSLCLNNATCLDLVTTNEDIEMNNVSNDLFQCLCPEGFHGKLCETKIINNYCTEIVCQNGGQCNILDNGKEYCTCLNNYHGLYCEAEKKQTEQNVELFKTEKEQNEIKKFDCFNTPCLNNGTCHVLDDISNFSTITTINNATVNINSRDGSTVCHCKPGFSGRYCENVQDSCQHVSCHNGGVCMSQDDNNAKNLSVLTSKSSYTCICQPGYSGKHCEINVYDCFNQPCGSYGICKDEIDSYHCECLKGWKGLHCDKKSLSIKQIRNEKNTESNSVLMEMMMMHNNSKEFHFNRNRLCPENYCANSAICISINDDISSFKMNNTEVSNNWNVGNEYQCLCETAIGRFKGTYCDMDVNECSEAEENQSSLCQNGGQCINTYGSYICSCTKPYHGKHCEHSFNPCDFDSTSICFNGGTCLPTSDGLGTICVCPKGFTGPQCREQINECINEQSCTNGICLDLIGTYYCLCPTGRYGMNCEFTGKQICTNQSCGEDVNVRNCTTHLCLNSGTCISHNAADSNITDDENHNNTHIPQGNNLLESQVLYCSCPFGYIGEYCQIELDFCQLFHYIKHYLLDYFIQPKEIEDYFLKNLTISSYLINDWLISSTLLSSSSSLSSYSWDEINLLYSIFIINYTNSQLLNNTDTRKILSTGNIFKHNSTVDRKNISSNSTLFMISSPMGLCDSVGSSQCIPLLFSTSDNRRSISNGFECICRVDYEGRYCEKYVDFCNKMDKQYNGNYCLNGGWCENQIKQISSNYNYNNDNNNTDIHRIFPYCHCPSGYGGKRCEFYHESCIHSPCLHGGKCYPIKQNLSQLQLEEIELNSMISRNNSTSSFFYSSYKCECSFGWSGVHCEVSTGLYCDASKLCMDHINCNDSLTSDCPCTKPGYCGLDCDRFGTECFLLTNKSNGEIDRISTTVPITTTIATTTNIITTTIISTNKVTWNNVEVHTTIKNITLWPGEETELSYCLRENCQLKKHNGQCDHECDLIACDFDHGDCLYALSVPLNPLSYIEHLENEGDNNNDNTTHYVSFLQDIQIKQQRPEPAIPWRSCSVLIEHVQHSPCHLLFGDGNCDPQCFKEECLFDGWDCIQTNVDLNLTKENCSESSCQNDYHTKTMECSHNDRDNCTLNNDLKKNIMSSTDSAIIYNIDNSNNFTNNISSGTRYFTNHIVPGSLVLLINSTPEELVKMHSEKLSIFSILNEILHLEVEVEHHPKTGDLMIYPVIYVTNYTNNSNRNSLFGTIQLKNNDLLTFEQSDTKSTEIRSRYSRHVNMKASLSSSLSGQPLQSDRNEQKMEIYQKESVGSQVYLQLNSKKCDETGKSDPLFGDYCITVLHIEASNLNVHNCHYSLAVSRLRQIWDEKYSDVCTGIKLHTIENIPVTYRAVDQCVNSLWKENPDLVIHVGMDTSLTMPTLETLSYNSGYDTPDVDGAYCRNNGCASIHGEPVLYCSMNLSKAYGKLVDNHITCATSNDPGRFLCGYIYYKSLEYSPDRVVFVHVPCSTTMSTENTATSLLQIIRELATLKGVVIPYK
ncbi:unnamed protein product [Schistosoma turkestanicum]|nr:unnamed protein product [Schistosoma turkestanicum]